MPKRIKRITKEQLEEMNSLLDDIEEKRMKLLGLISGRIGIKFMDKLLSGQLRDSFYKVRMEICRRFTTE